MLALFVVLFVVALDLGASVAFVFGASVFGVVVVVDFVEGVKDFVVLAGALNPPPPDFAFAAEMQNGSVLHNAVKVEFSVA